MFVDVSCTDYIIIGNCLLRSLIYQATVTSKNEEKIETYIGLTEGTFKTRYNNHKTTFANTEERNSTANTSGHWRIKISALTSNGV